ncbi:MAG: DUF1294 domain-containing protein [Bacteroidales bacterium]
MLLFLIYFLFINLFSFILFGIDKRRARKNEWRIPEKHLFLCALAGGTPGAWAGMKVFRHKTKHFKFSTGIPVLLSCQLLLTGYIYYRIAAI